MEKENFGIQKIWPKKKTNNKATKKQTRKKLDKI